MKSRVVRAKAALELADWLESTRVPDGYGGPVAHWWRDCLVDCRPGHDWRYEGILTAYLGLYAASKDGSWLRKARLAGEDLVRAQTVDGHYRQSRFELNPGTGGTPHEIAADIGLLRLARTLRGIDVSQSDRFLKVARINIDVMIARLWDDEAQRLLDDPSEKTFVPNKAATAIEAFSLLTQMVGEERYVRQYVEPIADAIVGLQVQRPGSPLDGAIAQISFGTRIVETYFPYYVARCIPGLIAANAATKNDRFLEAAWRAGQFVARSIQSDGGLPQVVYDGGLINTYPRWIAGTGDVLLALQSLRPLGFQGDLSSTEDWLLQGILPTGGVMTARGFAYQGGEYPERGSPPEFRDLLSVAGWADKALRYFSHDLDAASIAEASAGLSDPTTMDQECSFLGRPYRMICDREGVELLHRRQVAYRWRVGSDWAELLMPELGVR